MQSCGTGTHGMRLLHCLLMGLFVGIGRSEASFEQETPSVLPHQDKPAQPFLVLRPGRLFTGHGTPLENGTVILQGGKIHAVGKDLAIPVGAVVLDLPGRTVIPGLIDSASRLMLAAGERSPGAAEQSVLDSLDHYLPDTQEALRYGVTTVHLSPPGTGPIQGLGATLRPTPVHRILAKESALKVSLASQPETSSTAQRYEAYQQIRAAFEAARQYQKAREKYRKDLAEFDARQKETAKTGASPAEPQKVRMDRRNEVLLRALDPSNPLPVRIEAHTPDAIFLALKLAEDFKLRAILENATDGTGSAEAIAASKIPVIAGPMFRYGIPQVDYLNHSVGLPGALVRAGSPLAIASFGDDRAGHPGPGGTRFLLESAALACSGGLKPETALAAVTLEAARVLGLDKTHGSIEKGKAADLVVLSGDPFDPETVVERTILDGETVYERRKD